MLRYKLLLTGRKNNLEKSNLEKLDNLENEGMIDLMSHQFDRYKNITWMSRPHQIWQSWIRR